LTIKDPQYKVILIDSTTKQKVFTIFYTAHSQYLSKSFWTWEKIFGDILRYIFTVQSKNNKIKISYTLQLWCNSTIQCLADYNNELVDDLLFLDSPV